MNFAGLVKQSLVDYPGEVAAVLFSQGCNMSCPFCHNGHLILSGKTGGNGLSALEIEAFLKERFGFLDAVVFSGGEPTLQTELPGFIEKIKSLGYKVKLDTNGTHTAMLDFLLKQGLLDYVAMDIKAPLDYKAYLAACGNRLSPQNFMNIRNSMHLLMEQNMMVEFRTTIVPALHQETDVIEIAQAIKGAKLYSLQQFNPENPWNVRLKLSTTYAPDELRAISEQCAAYVEKVRVLTM